MYYGHSLEGKPENYWQPLKEHLENTSQLSAKFADKFGAYSLGRIAGLLHDIGKYSDEFQQRLRGSPIRVDHSTAGALEAIQLYGKALGTLLAYVIAGHHAGLPDFGTPADHDSLCYRLERPPSTKWDHYKGEISPLPAVQALPIKSLSHNPGFSLQLFIRFLFSCLVDADFLDTEAFYDSQKSSTRVRAGDLSILYQRIHSYLDSLSQKAPETPVNRRRQQILEHVQNQAALNRGIFTLTVPTGGGKTLTSLSFAVKHAINHGMDRVIYIIPYTSIIEQNANVFRRIVGAENVLEHHSNYTFPDLDDETWSPAEYRLQLAAENWDAPIVVSTNVQFFESLFAAKSSRCRKLHNIANSVVILDEAQMLPTQYLKPCLLALTELVRNYNCSIVLCTATQPALSNLLPEGSSTLELAPDPPQLYQAFKRVQITNLGFQTDDELAARIRSHDQVLCIVNTRRHAGMLFELLKDEPDVYHLSALMYPAHRSQKLAIIREALASGKSCRVVSTQLIEAGVDVDFPVVYRAIAGIDSIAQAAGRCNREGRLSSGQVYLFDPEPHGKPSGWLKETAAIAEMVLRKHADPLSLEAVEEYFSQLFDFEGHRLDKHEIITKFEERRNELAFPFREVATTFQIIEQEMVSLIIPRDDECLKVLADVRWRGPSQKASRALQRYTVQVYPYQLHQLSQIKAVERVAGNYIVLRDLSLYNEERGLVMDDSVSLTDILIF